MSYLELKAQKAKLKEKANKAKEVLMEIEAEFEELNDKGNAKTLSSIIARLEAWQNKP